MNAQRLIVMSSILKVNKNGASNSTTTSWRLRAVRRSSFLFSIALGVSMPLLASAQVISQAQMRAANLARMEIERLNGGLNKYFTGQCMHQKGGGSCMIRSDAQGFLFRFPGGAPGWEAKQKPATLESEILISPDGTRIEKVEYNGAPRAR